MKILFCSDGSSPAENALRFGAKIAAASQAETVILGTTEKAGEENALSQALQRAQSILKEYQLAPELVTRVGNPEREIVKHTMETHYDLVVIGAVCKNTFRRLLDPWWISVHAYRAHKIIESILSPVLVVFCDRPALQRILLCTDANAYFDKAIQFIGKIAQPVGAVVNLFHVMPEPPAMYADLIRLEDDIDRVLESNSKLGKMMRHQKELLEQLGVFGEIRLRHGDVTPELLKELKEAEYDLVVSGTPRAESKLQRYVMGDVTREITQRAELPVLVIRTGQGQFSRFFRELTAPLFRRSRKTSEGSHS
jgi:nucleotide-binding universal stress UspA family protein